MRIAFISDIHANIVSFEAVLADIDKSRVDQVIFLGDAMTLGPQPVAVMDRLMALGVPCVMGNHDAFVLDRSTAPDLDWVSGWYANQLTDAHLEFLRTFVDTYTIKLDAESQVLCFHGSPQNNTDQIFPSTSGEKMEKYLAGYEHGFYVCGHTHIQMMKQYKGKIIVNAGCVGMPFEMVPFPDTGPRFLSKAEYAILNWDDGDYAVELRSVKLDMVKLKESYYSCHMPDATYWWGLWLQ